MPWAALNAHRDRLEVETGVPRRRIAEEPPLVPVHPHGVETGGRGDEHGTMLEVAGDLAQPAVVLRATASAEGSKGSARASAPAVGYSSSPLCEPMRMSSRVSRSGLR